MKQSMHYFVEWLHQNWNELINKVAPSAYFDIRCKYVEVINNEINLRTLYEEDGIISVRNNFILLIVEKWLYRQAAIHEPNYKKYYREHIDARTALIYRFLYSKEKELFYDFDKNNGFLARNFDLISQFYAFWLGFSTDKKLAKNLIKNINNQDQNLFVVFMGLRKLGLFSDANRIGQIIGYKVDDYYPRISTNTASLSNFYAPIESLALIKKAGFDTFDYSMEKPDKFFTSDDYLNKAIKLRKYADKIGLKCNQTHSIFPVWNKSLSEDEIKNRTIYTERIIEITKILGGICCVIHPINDFDECQNYDYFNQYLPLARKLNVNIACENMYNWENDKATLASCSNHHNYEKLLNMINDSCFVACLDIGHAEMDGLETSAVEMIERLGKKLKCLHIHDNDLHYDRHGLPLSEKIDFDLVLDALARIDYHGDITFECDGFILRMPPELHLSCLKMLYAIGVYLRNELLIRRKALCIKK